MAKIMISLPDELLEKVDAAAARSSRPRSELVREALRQYLAGGGDLSRRRAAIRRLREGLASGDWRAEDFIRSDRNR